MTAIGSVPAGTRVGRYEILSLLRQGGMGEVYAANDCSLGRRVALKILPKNRTSDPDRVARFVREARASSTLNHPSIVSVHDAGSDGDVHFLAMELIDGKPLSEWMRRRSNVAQRVEVMAQIADGLAGAHGAGIVHRDLKPDNIMITSDGRAKIVDFGVAKLTERATERSALSGITTPTSRVGTTAYMSPEQIEGKPLDHRTDVFSFGTVLYELLTGVNPFAAAQYADTIHNVVHLEPSLERIPRQLQRVVRRCLRKEPGLRYDSMRDVALDLREALDDVTPKRKRSLWWLAATLPVLLAVAWFAIPRPAVETKPMLMTRLTNSGRVRSAAITPDGKYLVHAVQEGDREALYVKQIASGTTTQILEPRFVYYFNLQVSPDGNYAYYSYTTRDEPNVAHVEQLPLMGGVPRRIASDTEFWFSVSPDGREVVFRRFNAIDRMHVLTVAAVDGGGERVVLRHKHPEYIETPVWAPDGSITFRGGNLTRKEDGKLFRLRLETGAVEMVETPKFPFVGSYTWLRDESGALMTVYDREQPPQIWFVSEQDKRGRKVTSEVSAYYAVTAAADSRSFAAVREVVDTNIETYENGAVQALTTGFGNYVGGGGVRWINDREVMFSSFIGSMNTFLVVDARGGEPRRLIHNMSMWNAAVSPDGRFITFVSDKSGSNQIWLANSDGTGARQLTKEGTASWPSFSPDGKWVVYQRHDESQYAWRVPVQGGQPVALTSVPTYRPTVSPDGRLLLARLRSPDGKGPLWRTAVAPLDGRGETRFFAVPRFGGPPILQWHPDGGSFFFVDYKDGVANLWTQHLDGSEPRQLTSFKSGDIYSYDVAPDGRRIVFGRGAVTRDAVLIRHFR